jgi:hypothetical protein
MKQARPETAPYLEKKTVHLNAAPYPRKEAGRDVPPNLRRECWLPKVGRGVSTRLL